MSQMTRDQKDKAGWGAFPNVTTDGCDSDMGITVRDYFAAKALPTAMTASWRDIGYEPQDGLSDMQQHARLAYQMADAMLAERAA